MANQTRKKEYQEISKDFAHSLVRQNVEKVLPVVSSISVTSKDCEMVAGKVSFPRTLRMNSSMSSGPPESGMRRSRITSKSTSSVKEEDTIIQNKTGLQHHTHHCVSHGKNGEAQDYS